MTYCKEVKCQVHIVKYIGVFSYKRCIILFPVKLWPNSTEWYSHTVGSVSSIQTHCASSLFNVLHLTRLHYYFSNIIFIIILFFIFFLHCSLLTLLLGTGGCLCLATRVDHRAYALLPSWHSYNNSQPLLMEVGLVA